MLTAEYLGRRADHFDLLTTLAMDRANRWSVGTFGAIGEFLCDAEELAEIDHKIDAYAITTQRGGMRISPSANLIPIAWDILSADGQSWHHELAFCVACPEITSGMITPLGSDRGAIRVQDRGDQLFDLGVGAGAVRMCVRTSDAALIEVMTRARGADLLSSPEVVRAIMDAQPHRVMLSPAARIEVYQPIPLSEGVSPTGPHTHLLPKLIAAKRTHCATAPIPSGLQAALSMHPQSPWRTALGEPCPFDPAVDAAFAPLLVQFGLDDDASVEAALNALIDAGAAPEFCAWPETRRGRAKARIVLRRMAAAGDERVRVWRAIYDRAGHSAEDIAGPRPMALWSPTSG